MTSQAIKFKKVSLITVIDNLVSAVIVLDRDSTIIFANRMASFLSDKPTKYLCGLRGGEAFDCIHAVDVPQGCGHGPKCKFCKIRQVVDASFRDRCNKVSTDVGMEFKDAGFRYLKLATTYLDEEDIVILALEDITDMKILAAERLESEKLLAAIETAGAVCHEMNQPLQVISGYLFLISKDKIVMQTISKQISRMQDQIERLTNISRKLHSLKRYSSKEYDKRKHILDIVRSSAPI